MLNVWLGLEKEQTPQSTPYQRPAIDVGELHLTLQLTLW